MRPPFIALCLTLGALTARAEEPKLTYPNAKTVEQTDTYHGTAVPDPYRWLEDDVRKSPEVAAWVEAENKVTEAYLKAIPERDAIKKRLTELWNYEKISAPSKIGGGQYLFSKNDGLQNQNVLYIQNALDAEARELVDPNKWVQGRHRRPRRLLPERRRQVRRLRRRRGGERLEHLERARRCDG